MLAAYTVVSDASLLNGAVRIKACDLVITKLCINSSHIRYCIPNYSVIRQGNNKHALPPVVIPTRTLLLFTINQTNEMLIKKLLKNTSAAVINISFKN